MWIPFPEWQQCITRSTQSLWNLLKSFTEHTKHWLREMIMQLEWNAYTIYYLPFTCQQIFGNNPSLYSPDTTCHSHTFFDSDEFQKDTSTHETDTAISKNGMKRLNDFFMTWESVSHVKFAEGRLRGGSIFLT